MISVVLPVRDGDRYLAEALKSVLTQKVAEPLEVIVIDDGSRDRSAQIARSFGPRVRCETLPPCGPARARNRGLSLARGRLVSFIDADDLWLEGRLARHAAWLDREPGTAVVLGRVQYVLEDLTPYGAPHPAYSLGAATFRPEAFTSIGPLDERLRGGDDTEWFLRAHHRGLRVGRDPEAALHYRLHARNMTRDKGQRDRDLLMALKVALDRRRGSP